MGSYENIVKIEEMKRKVEEGDLQSAQKILDTMEIKKIKNILDINLMAEVFESNGKYEEAKDLYFKIYEKTHSRKSLFKLLNILIKLNSTEDAQFYYEQYEKIAPGDFYVYIFRYYIEKLKGGTYDKLISILEELKKQEYTEKWAYELAKLYYKAGMEEECIRECSDIILWFGDGTYVEKAKILRSYYSGETDKEGIMQEIKRRAESISGSTDFVPVESDNSDNNNAEEEDNSCGAEEAPYYSQDFVHDDSDNFEYELKADVQNYMDEDYRSYNTDLSGDNYAADEQLITENMEYEQIDDSQNEDDIKLKQLEKEHNFNANDLFGDYLLKEKVKNQIVNCLENIIQENSNNVMALITGSKGSGKTTLAKDIALFLNSIGKLKTSKLAKINAEKLNTIDVFSKKDVLRDCCLVIENANVLTKHTIERVLDLSRELPCALAVVFEDNKKSMNKLFREYPQLMDMLKNRIHL
jgi:hypothetical protein